MPAAPPPALRALSFQPASTRDDTQPQPGATFELLTDAGPDPQPLPAASTATPFAQTADTVPVQPTPTGDTPAALVAIAPPAPATTAPTALDDDDEVGDVPPIGLARQVDSPTS
ncbi:hypothetical protein [Nocardia sp. NPDC050406]|uniref:hypothetical protein n=1 Tax=Nocardia sp. NPDC050406 TaxID=3364318 RepID=UPI00379FB237